MTNKEKIDELSGLLKATREAVDEITNTCTEEKRDMSPDELAKQDELTSECDRLLNNIESYQKIEAIDARKLASKRTVKPEEGRVVQPTSETRVEFPRAQHKLVAFRGTNAEKNAYASGKWCAAHLFNDEKSRTWCREHGIESRVMSEGVMAKGGATVPDVMENAIIDLRDEYGMARRECNFIAMSSDVQTVARRTGGVTAYFPSELEATTVSDMAWDNVNLVAKEVSALTYVSKSLQEDSIINMADKIAEEIAFAFAVKEDECLVDGDGTNTYGGITGFRAKLIDGNHAGAIIEATANDDQFAELLQADIISMIAPLAKFANRDAKLRISPYGWGAAILRLLAAANGNAISDINNGSSRQYMGFPVIVEPAMPGKAATNYNDLVMFTFGNLKQAATFGSRRGVTIEVDTSRRLEFRQLAILGTERFDIVVHDLGDANSNTSPLIGIIGTS